MSGGTAAAGTATAIGTAAAAGTAATAGAGLSAAAIAATAGTAVDIAGSTAALSALSAGTSASLFTLGNIGSALSIGGTILGGASSLGQGQAAKAYGKYQAAQLENNANASNATAQRQSLNDVRKAAYLQSRVKADAAGGGGDTTDSGTQGILSGIDQVGQQDALTDLYNGQERASGDYAQANADVYQGDKQNTAAIYSALGTGVKGFGTILSKGNSTADYFSQLPGYQ